jgi:hypothetical protein
MLDKFLKMFFALFVLVVMVILIGPQKSLMWLLRGVLVGCAIKSLWHLARIVALKTTLRAFHRENPRYQNWTKCDFVRERDAFLEAYRLNVRRLVTALLVFAAAIPASLRF